MGTEARATNQGLGAVGAGAVTGAAIGSIIPGVGTLVGGAVGAVVGGIASAFKSSSKAKKYAKKAKKVQQEREANAEEENYLQMIREARTARAGSLASAIGLGIGTSSLTSSALSSIGSQGQHNVQYTANDARLVELYNKYMKKAGAYSNAAATTLKAGQIVGTALGVGAAFSSASSAASAWQGANTTGISSSYAEAMATETFRNTLKSGLNYVSIGNQVMSGMSSYM